MPGRKINAKQVGFYMKSRKEGKAQETAAVKAGFSERSARYLKNRDYKTTNKIRHWRTRKDPFECIWEIDIVSRLEKNPELQARTLLELLQEKYEGQFPDSKLRTLERRVREWKAKFGPEKEVIFRQEHPPGWQGLSDYTDARSLGITIDGKPLEHRLYHYRLAYSGWEYAAVILGGESYTSLAENLQNALWLCGGSPKTHRTDSLSAAFKNLSALEKDDLTERYQELCALYGMEPTRNNKGVSHENGSIESSHRHLKKHLSQALLVRGSSDFKNIDEYRQFVREVVNRHNRRIQKRYIEELEYLSSLPEGRSSDYTEERVRVTTSSTIQIKSVIYSVPSRLIGMTLKVHIFDDRLECFTGTDLILTLSRLRKSKVHRSAVDYKHIIDQLSQKPGAFRNYVFRDACFPTLAFRQTWERLDEDFGGLRACKEYILILKIAAKDDQERRVNNFLERELGAGRCPLAKVAGKLFQKRDADIPKIESACKGLGEYGRLLKGGAS